MRLNPNYLPFIKEVNEKSKSLDSLWKYFDDTFGQGVKDDVYSWDKHLFDSKIHKYILEQEDFDFGISLIRKYKPKNTELLHDYVLWRDEWVQFERDDVTKFKKGQIVKEKLFCEGLDGSYGRRVWTTQFHSVHKFYTKLLDDLLFNLRKESTIKSIIDEIGEKMKPIESPFEKEHYERHFYSSMESKIRQLFHEVRESSQKLRYYRDSPILDEIRLMEEN